MSEGFDVLIVGGGHAGAQTAIALRQRGFAATIGIVSAETDLPYERPPLSKDYLSGAKGFDRMLIRPRGFWAERGVELLLGRTIVSIDPSGKRVTGGGGQELGYGTLIWAAGGAPRRLSCAGGDLPGVHSIRSRADVDQLVAELPRAKRIVVVGGGYIGLEAAAVLTGLGKSVALLEAADRVLSRVAGEPISRFYEAEHRAHGVDIRLNAKVECIEGLQGAVAGVRLQSGELLPCEAVIVAIGIDPVMAPLVEAGADSSDGLLVDEYCRTSLSDVFAAGDCAAHVSGFGPGGRVRLESVQNAHDQANTIAKFLSGAAEPYSSVPWFWSNQYDLRLQTVGLSLGYDQMVVRGDPASRSFSIVYLRHGGVAALDCVNNTRDYAQGRALVLAKAQIPLGRLGDASEPLKNMLTI